MLNRSEVFVLKSLGIEPKLFDVLSAMNSEESTLTNKFEISLKKRLLLLIHIMP
jgi:hypothetical protein